MNVAVPSDQHSDRFGQPASSHTVTRSSERIVFFSSITSGPSSTFGRSQSGLRVSIDRPPVTPAASSRAAAAGRHEPDLLAGPFTAGERRQVAAVGGVRPRDVLALERVRRAQRCGGESGDDVDDLAPSSTSTPSSASDVTGLSPMPHGTMCSRM